MERPVDDRLEYTVRNAKTRVAAAKRNAPGNAGHAGPPDAGFGPGPRTHHSACHRARVGGCPADRTRFSLPRLASIGGSRLDCIVLGHVGKQPQSEVLPSDTRRAETV